MLHSHFDDSIMAFSWRRILRRILILFSLDEKAASVLSHTDMVMRRGKIIPTQCTYCNFYLPSIYMYFQFPTLNHVDADNYSSNACRHHKEWHKNSCHYFTCRILHHIVISNCVFWGGGHANSAFDHSLHYWV